MPLAPGNSRATISKNIDELTHHGSRPRSHDQIVAIALSNADRHPRAMGGNAPMGMGGMGMMPNASLTGRMQTMPVMPMQPRAGLAGGGIPSFVQRGEAREMQDPYHPGGLIESDAAGRTDRVPLSVAADSFVMPADVVSGLGQNNTLAGAKIMDAILGTGPYGTHLPRARRADGGGTGVSHVMVAGGEYLVDRPKVEALGRRMRAAKKSKARTDLAAGHEALRDLVTKVRKAQRKFLAHAPEPKK